MNKKKTVILISILFIFAVFSYSIMLKRNQGKLEINLKNGEMGVTKSYYFVTYSRKETPTIFTNYIKSINSQKDRWEEVTATNRLKHVISIIKMLKEVKSLGESEINMKMYVTSTFDLLQEKHSSVAEEYVSVIWREWMEKTVNTPSTATIK